MIREEQYFHYIVSSRLGVGSFGEVCKVKRLTDGKSFALKTLKDGIVKRNPRILQMLNHEVSGLLGKFHPHMVTMHDAFTIKGDFYLIYELCEPQSLKTRLKQGAIWSEEQVIDLAKSMVKILHFLHGFGILHRDIKPDNMLVKSNEYKLADFGLCYRGGSHYDNDLIGSPAYLAPEIFKKRFYSEKSDIYALGISLFELYIGKYPFDQKNEAALYKKKMEFVPNRETMPNATEQFITLLRMMCHPVENKRATIEELVIALDIQFDTTNAAIQNHISEFSENAPGANPYQQQQPSQYNHQVSLAPQSGMQQGYDMLSNQDHGQLQQVAAPVSQQFNNQMGSLQNQNFNPQEYMNLKPQGATQDQYKGGYYDPWVVTPTTTAPTSNTGSFSNEGPAPYGDQPAGGFVAQSSYNNLFDENFMRRVPYKNQPFMAIPDGTRPQQRSEHRQDFGQGPSQQVTTNDYSNPFGATHRRGRDLVRDENTKPVTGVHFDLYNREQPQQLHRAFTTEDRSHKAHERSQSSQPVNKRFISSNRMNVDSLINPTYQAQNPVHASQRPAFEPIVMNHRSDLLAIPVASPQEGRPGSRHLKVPELTDDMSPNTSKKYSRYLRTNEEQGQQSASRADLPFLPQTRTMTAVSNPQQQNFFNMNNPSASANYRTSNFAGSLRNVIGSPNQPGSFMLSEQTSPSPMISPMRTSPSYATPVGGHPQFFQQKTLQLQPVPAPADPRYLNKEAQNILAEINTFTEQIQPQRQRARQIFDEYQQGPARNGHYH